MMKFSNFISEDKLDEMSAKDHLANLAVKGKMNKITAEIVKLREELENLRGQLK